MAIKADKKIFWFALLITAVIFLSVILTANIMSISREKIVDTKLNELSSEYKDINTLYLLSDIYGDQFFCIGVKTQLEELDKSLWNTGAKIEKYQEASSTFIKDAYYKDLKTIFNQNLIYYLSLFKNYQLKCQHTDNIIIYFYKNSKECSNCDSQSFVLTNIKEDLKEGIFIFSFDTDLDIKSVEALKEFYEVDEYPCLIIHDKKFCGLKNKDDVLEEVCLYHDSEYCQEFLSN